MKLKNIRIGGNRRAIMGVLFAWKHHLITRFSNQSSKSNPASQNSFSTEYVIDLERKRLIMFHMHIVQLKNSHHTHSTS